MTLRLTRVRLRDFRSYDSFELANIGDLTVFVGPNAIGKTNIVEGVQLMTALGSFRHATIEQMVRRGASRALIDATLEDESRLLELSLIMEDHVRRYKLNGKAKRPSDLRGMAPSIAFTPDDLDMVKGSAGARRRALDALGGQVNANYDAIVRDYKRVLQHKNRLLKEEASDGMLDSINDLMITCGAQLTCYRRALLDRLEPYMFKAYEGISGNRETLGCVFTPSWAASSSCPELGAFRAFTRDEAREALARALEQHRAEERARRRALVGPHADVISFELDGMDASCYGSQGQQRSIVLCYKIAEARIVEEVLGVKPLLLLDDVMSELDGARREALVSFIAQDVQTIVTTANLAYFDAGMLARADVVELPLVNEGV